MRHTAVRVLGAFALFLSGQALAQDYRYHVFIDRDARPDTGCSQWVGAETIGGAEERLTANVTGTSVTSVTRASCSGGTFGAEQGIGGPHPVGLNNGTAGGDVIELAVARAALGAGGVARLAVAGENGAGTAADVLATQSGGGPIIIDLFRAAIPTLGVFGLLLLVGALLLVASRKLKFGLASVGALLVAGAVWAANFVTDGQVGDWAGQSALATDANGDATGTDPGAELLAFFGAEENGSVFFRIDVADVENQVPLAQPQTLSFNEDSGAQAINLVATDGDGDPLTYAITTNPTRGVLSGFNAATGAVTYTPNANAEGADSFSFTASDGLATSAPATIGITLTPVNDAPVAQDATFSVPENSANGTTVGTPVVATDVDTTAPNNTLSYAITAGNTSSAFTIGAGSGQITVANSAALDFKINPTFALTVTVSDGGAPALSDTATVTINLGNLNEPPVFQGEPYAFTLAENSAAATVVGSVPALDQDLTAPNNTLTYAITSGNDAGAFAINAASGQITVANSAPLNFETTPGFTLGVSVTDGGTPTGTDTSTVTINLSDVNEAPTVTGGTFTLAENSANGTAVGSATATDPDLPAQTFAWAITGGNTGLAFAINPATGAITVATSAAVDFESSPTFTLTVQATDNGAPAQSGTATVTVNLSNVNEAPVHVGAPYTTSVPENSANGTSVFTVAATDVDAGSVLTHSITGSTVAGAFAINGATGEITVANSAALDTKTNPSITLNVQVTDNGAPTLNAATTVTITVGDVNEAPVFQSEPYAFSIAENAAIGTAVGSVPALDQDLPAQTLTYSIVSGNGAGVFAINAATGAITVAIPPDFETLASYSLGVNVSDGGLSDASTVAVTITNVNEAPVNTVPAGPLSIATGATLAIAGISVADVDAAAGSLQTTINVAPLGTLTATPSGGAGVVGNGTSSITITGALPGLNATLATLQFSSASGGATTLSMTTSDQGNTGSGGAQSDGPDTLAITVDKGPEVTSVNPADAATGVLIGSNVVVTFDEAVTVAGNWAQLVCTTSGTRSVGAGTLAVTDADPVFTLNPTVDLTAGESCTLTVFSGQVTDDDAIDPPDTMPLDFSSSFVTQDLAPTISSALPAAAAVVAQNQTVTLNFSEPVDVAAGAITWNCGGVVAFTPALPQTGVSSLTLTPTVALNAGAACTVAVESTLVTDADAVDPPNQLDGDNSGDLVDGDADDFALAFSVDAAPAFTTSVPAAGDLNVSPSANIVVNFSEPVTATATSFTIDCGTGDLGEVVSGSGTAAITLDPTADLPGGASCTVTGVPLQIDDSDTIDPPANPTAFAFSFTTASLAADDSYNVTPQLTLAANSGTQGDVDANDQLGGGAITGFGATLGTANDTAPNGTNAITAGGSGGRVVLAADGSFSFFPDAGDASPATATFFYTVTGGDTAMVTLTFAADELVWFIDDNAAGTTCTGSNVGAQACPATTFAAISASDTAGDTLYFADGNHSVTAVLENNARVIGQASTQSLTAFTGIIPVNGSTFPALGGAAPVLSSAGVVLTLDATAGNQHRLRGFNIGNAATDIAGLNFGALDVAEVALTGTGMALNLNNGTLAGGFNGVTSTASSAQGLALQNISVGGTFGFGGTNISGSAAQGLVVSNSPANLDFGVTVVNLAGGSDAISLQTSSGGGTRSFSSVTVTNVGGVGLLLFNAGNTSIGGGNIATSNRAAIDANGTNALAITLASVSSINSTGKGINVDAATGTLSIAGGTISGSANEAFDLNAGSAVISYAGTIAKNTTGRLVDITGRTAGNVTLSGNLSCTSPCTGINVANNTGGTIAFSAATKTLNTGTSNAVTLATNTGATINFSGGGLDLDSTSGGGMIVSGGGTISVQGTGNSIASTTGTALSVINTTIGASGLTFQSISANGGANGITLNNTGASGGGLSVTGTGGAGTGGTIQNSTGTGILLASTGPVSLSSMVVSASGDDGINGASVSGLTLNGLSLTNNGNSATDEGLQLTQLSGAASFTNNTFTGSAHNHIYLQNTSTTVSSLAITNNMFNANSVATGNHAVLIEGVTGAPTFTSVNISSNQFISAQSIGLQVVAIDNTSMPSLTISGNTFTNNILAVDVSLIQGSNVTFTAANNTVTTNRANSSHALNSNHGIPSTGTVQGRFENNIIGTAGVAGSGSPIGNGIRVIGNDNGTKRYIVTGSTIRETRLGRGIEVVNRNGSGAMDATVTNNIVNTDAQPADFPLSAIFVQANCAATCNSLRADIASNTVAVPSGGCAFDLTGVCLALVRSGATSTCQLVDRAPAGAATANAEIIANNPASASTSASAACSLIPGPIAVPP